VAVTESPGELPILWEPLDQGRPVEDDREHIRRWLDALFRDRTIVGQIDAIVTAETFDLPVEMMAIVESLPPGRYTRLRLCDQLNSAIVGRGLSRAFGTHE
jgi:predicted oxidoreductase